MSNVECALKEKCFDAQGEKCQSCRHNERFSYYPYWDIDSTTITTEFESYSYAGLTGV